MEAQGVQLQRGDASSPQSFVSVGKVLSVGDVGVESSTRDVTTIADTFRKFKNGLKEGNALTLGLFYDPDDTPQSDVRSDVGGAARNYRLVLTDSPATTITFEALVTSWSLGAEVDEEIPINFGFKINSEPVFA